MVTIYRYTIGKVIGAGSFGVVREAVHKKTNVHYACKTIPKLPKKGRGTPRYLLKIQTEVDAMLQLGPSLDAVFLQVPLLASLNLCLCLIQLASRSLSCNMVSWMTA